MALNIEHPNTFPPQKANIILKGPAGNIEAATTEPKVTENQSNQKNITAIICHPHPLHGGTMNNKVVTSIARACNDLNFRTVRFNYRGVGNSEGEYADMIGETEDCLAVVRWVQQVRPDDRIVLAGFSFGSFIAANTTNKLDNDAVIYLLNIAPAVTHADFDSLTNINCPWLVIQGEADEVISSEEVFAWAEQKQVELIRMPNTSHFFHGKLIELRELIIQKLAKL